MCVCDESCAGGYILYLPQKCNRRGTGPVLFYSHAQIKYSAQTEARLMCTNNHIVFSHPPWWIFCYRSVWCNIIYCCLNSSSASLPVLGSFSVYRMSGLYLCHINIETGPTCPLSSLPVVPKGGGPCERYSCQRNCNMTLCSGCWWLLHGICPWDDCFVQGHCMYAVCVCVCQENICWLSLPWQVTGFVEYRSTEPSPCAPAVSLQRMCCAEHVCRISMLMWPCAEWVLCY